MKNSLINNKKQRRSTLPKQEQGLSLLMALMMGMVLTAGVSGLLIRQLTARKLAASESYQQMAETAALNGFNRILSELNDDDSDAYKGYLLTLDHNGGNIEIPGSEEWGWNADSREAFPLRELCTDRRFLPDAVPKDQSNTDPPPTDLTTSNNQRDDGKNSIKLQYRLRGYETTATAENNGLGEGTFQIEGLVVREGDSTGKNFLARTLLLRSLYISSIVAGEGDWAVLSGKTLSLGNTEILNSNNESGQGKVLLNVSSAEKYADPENCEADTLLSDAGAADNINLEGRIVPIFNKDLPTSSLWNLGRTQDQNKDSDKVRIWSFDDTNSLSECEEIACSRDSDEETAEGRKDLTTGDASVIRLNANELCGGEGNDCHIYVEHINLTQTKLFIETSERPQDEDENENPTPRKIRPVVLHLEYPGTSTVQPSEPNLTGSINLGEGSTLCGVYYGETECNERPEELIILSAAPRPAGERSCDEVNPEKDRYVLQFEGKSLPHATIHLMPGFVKTGPSSTSLNGLIWADGICTNTGAFSLNTDTVNIETDAENDMEIKSVIAHLNQLWGWKDKNFPGYGQTVTRGVRGTGLDTFRRW